MPDAPPETPAMEGTLRLLRDVSEMLAATGDRRQDALLAAIDGHLIPRIRHPDAPLVVAVAGLGGTGKSHVVNRLVGEGEVPEGPVRPTTTAPIVVASDRRAGAVWSELAASIERHAGDATIVRQTSPATEGATLIDLPATTDYGPIVDLADLCLVITTPTRYADAAERDLLADLHRRGIELAVVLNRAQGSDDEIADELGRMLRSDGIDAPVWCLGEGETVAPAGLVDRLRLPADIEVDGPSLRHRAERVARRLTELAGSIEEQRRLDAQLLAAVDDRYRAVAEETRRMVTGGELAGSTGSGWHETADRLAGIITHRIGVAAASVTATLAEMPRGAAIVETGGDQLWRHPPDAAAAARDRLAEWPGIVERMVVDEARRRLRPAWREALVEVVIALALGERPRVRRRHRRRLGTEPSALAARAREVLAGIAADQVMADRRRFADLVELNGPGPDEAWCHRLDGLARELAAAVGGTSDARGEPAGWRPPVGAEVPDA